MQSIYWKLTAGNVSYTCNLITGGLLQEMSHVISSLVAFYYFGQENMSRNLITDSFFHEMSHVISVHPSHNSLVSDFV